MHALGGVTKTERILHRLCTSSFLRLWTYGNVYKDQAISGENRQGKEICDALVVFRNNVIIFSDKEISFSDHEDVNIAWRRWHKRAIAKSREQLLGAERWLRNYSNRVFLDAACTEPLRSLPSDWDKARVYKVIVANGVGSEIQNRFGDTGSLILTHNGTLSIDDELEEEQLQPFTIETSASDSQLFHVFDEFNLSIILSQLDTVSDFVRYLEKREVLFRSGISFHAPGEEELLAYYLQHTDESGEHDFVFDGEYDLVSFESGLWDDFVRGEHRMSAYSANQQSYLWDQIIESITDSILEGTLGYPISEGRNREMRILEQLAGENRFRRRILSSHLLDVMFRPEIDMGMNARTVRSEPEGGPLYLFFALSRPPNVEDEVYRETRASLLFEYCRAARNHYKQAVDIYGIGTELNSPEVRSWDAHYYDGSTFTQEDARESNALADELGIYRNFHVYEGHYNEYPSEGAASRNLINSRRVKGRDRNRPCPCGSGRKYKRCCGLPRTPSRLEWLGPVEH